MALEKKADLLLRLRDQQIRLDEAEETLRALRDGEVDAIVSSGPQGDRVYTLQGADAAYRVMVEEMGEGALTVTVDGLILFSNEHFATMLRRPLQRVIGARLQDFFAPEDAQIVSSLLQQTVGSKTEAQLRTEDGGEVPVYLSIQNVVLDGVCCHCVIVTDLSDQKRHEEIAALLEAVPVGVVIAHDAECRSMVGNRMAYEQLRIPLATHIPTAESEMSWRVIRDGKDIPSRELPMRIAARTGRRVTNCEIDMLFDDGAYRSWLASAVPLFDEVGQPRGAVGAFVDITERKRTTEALEAANIELRNFGNALTQDLWEPLGAVVKFVRLLARNYAGTEDQVLESCISDSLNSASRIEALLQALMEYWSITERSGLNRAAVDCNQVLAQTLLNLQSAIQENGATVTSGILPTVAADPELLQRLLQTLIGNSMQYRDENPPSIHISAVSTFDRWLFSVRDNGIGIARDRAEEVFGMFKRLHGNDIPGTGVGLALCRKIIERHGGRIWVESETGRGAAFRFTIPSSMDFAQP